MGWAVLVKFVHRSRGNYNDNDSISVWLHTFHASGLTAIDNPNRLPTIVNVERV